MVVCGCLYMNDQILNHEKQPFKQISEINRTADEGIPEEKLTRERMIRAPRVQTKADAEYVTGCIEGDI